MDYCTCIPLFLASSFAICHTMIILISSDNISSAHRSVTFPEYVDSVTEIFRISQNMMERGLNDTQESIRWIHILSGDYHWAKQGFKGI